MNSNFHDKGNKLYPISASNLINVLLYILLNEKLLSISLVQLTLNQQFIEFGGKVNQRSPN